MSTELESRYARIGLVVDSARDWPRDFLDQYNDARESAIPIDFATKLYAIKLQSAAVD